MEETTYRTELVNQESRLQRLESDEGGEDEDGNREWSVRQEIANARIIFHMQKQAIQETKAIFEPLRQKVLGAVAGLEQLLNSPQAEQFSEVEVNGARELIVKAKAG
ncbi:MAG: hypothetical protein Q9221_004030 [Calogaya cf. arnoldii]